MQVSAVIPTRGDVPLGEILDSLPRQWEKIVVDNSRETQDFGVYARYIGVERASYDIIFTQDDDVIVSDPQAIVDAWMDDAMEMRERTAYPTRGSDGIHDHVACNMPQEFRHDFYRDHALVGFGAVFHRDAPRRAFDHWEQFCNICSTWEFRRCCDIAFTALTPRVLVDVPMRNLPWCDAPNRMWKQPDHQGERAAFLADVLRIRDASV